MINMSYLDYGKSSINESCGDTLNIQTQCLWSLESPQLCVVLVLSDGASKVFVVCQNYLRELLRVMTPTFHGHLKSRHPEALELLFVHRWLVLCFKREFPEGEALQMWEACWAHYQTDYFHLFLSAAIVALYGQDVVQMDMGSDEMLLHFSSLAGHMQGDLVLRKVSHFPELAGFVREWRNTTVKSHFQNIEKELFLASACLTLLFFKLKNI